MKATKGGSMQENYNSDSPAKILGLFEKGKKIYKGVKKIYKSITGTKKTNMDSMVYSPNPKKYHKKYNPKVTGNITYKPKSGGKTKIKVSEVTDKKGKTKLKTGAGTYDFTNNAKDRQKIDAIVNRMNKLIKKDKGFLNKLKDEHGNIVKRGNK
tara:strand:+ start:92 stop:553 length:462 start_codon:yes stop_codon:yes gene_type:complete